MSFVTMTHEHMRVSVVHYDTTDIPKFFKFFGAKSSSKGEPSDAGTAKGKESSTKRLSNTKAKRVNAAAGSSTALTNSAISAAAFASSVTLPVPVLNTGTPLDGSSADIHGAVNRLVGSLNKKVSKNTLRSIYNHVVDLREAERNQAHIVQALAHQMAELSVELEEFRSGRKDRRSTDVINAMIQVKAKGGSLIFDRSFSIRTINLIIEEHPELSSELGVLRDAIQEQENQMSDSLASLEADTHGKVFEAFKKIAKLEKHLEDKNAFIRGCYESMDKFEIECDARNEEITEHKVRINELLNELKRSTEEHESTQRKQGRTLLRLEEEKGALVDKIGLLEATLATERLKAINADEVKEVATTYSDEIKESYSFYRDFYKKQRAIYDQFIAPRNARVSSDDGTGVTSEGGGDREERHSSETSTSGAVKNKQLHLLTKLTPEEVSKAVRAKYREQLDDELHPQAPFPPSSDSLPPLRRVRGSAFLAMLNTRRTHSEPDPIPRTPSNVSFGAPVVHGSVQEQEAASSGSYYDESSGEFVRGTAVDCTF